MREMAARKDCYEVLGISRNADNSTIKKAYRKLAKKYHPDMNPGNQQAEQKFKEVTDAYNILSDPEKRKVYDRYGYAAFDGTGSESDFYKNQNRDYQQSHFSYDDMDGMFGDIFGDIFGNRGFHRTGFYQDGFRQEEFRQKGSDITADIDISFDEAVYGGEKLIHLKDETGKTITLKIQIPAGIDTGKIIRLRGKGQPGTGGEEAGDLLLQVTVGEKAGFERKGMDIYTTAEVPFTTAVFGGEALIQTLYGNVICKIREGTQSGSKIRLRGKGVVSMKNPSQKGDQYAVVQIKVPKNLTQEAKKKLKEYEALAEGKKDHSAA